jgi:PHD/YefM family antitoxin component YafN of YafNO toxin-antitoxin module
MKPRRRQPEVVLRNGKPAAVILDIHKYREMIERLENAEDLKALAEMRGGPLRFRRFERFLQGKVPRV